MSSTNVIVNPVEAVMESVKEMTLSDLLILQVRLASHIQKEAKKVNPKAKRVRDPSAPKKVPDAKFNAWGVFVKHLKQAQPELFASEKNVTTHQTIAKTYRLSHQDEYDAFVAKFVGASTTSIDTTTSLLITAPVHKEEEVAIDTPSPVATEEKKAKRAPTKKSKKTTTESTD
jgi:hypothetical protein